MPKKLFSFNKAICATLLFLFACSALLAQQTITGKVVTSADDQPLADATVQLKGSTNATKTGADGSFSLAVSRSSGVLTISTVGYESRDISFNGRIDLGNIALVASNESLNTVVVTGYTAQRKKDITGAVSVVNVANLKAVPSGTTESLLQGQASGVTVVNSGAPGSPSNIRIRGITSVGSTEPLVIIDGTPGNMHDLNVNDIQSIQVLKDAGAAAIYGVRGSNGVVIITTKRGRTGKPVVTYDAYIGRQYPLSDGWNLANPTESANAIWQQYRNSNLAPVHKQYGSGAEPVLPDYLTPTGAKEGDPNTDPSTYALYTNQITKANKAGTDWFHEIFKPAMIQSHSLSVGGGTDKSTYLFSLGYFDQQGTLINTSLKRYSARLNTTFTIKDNIRIGENAYFFFKKNPGYLGLAGVNNANAINSAYRIPAILPVYDIMGNFAGGGSQSLGNAPNPVAIQKRTANNVSNNYSFTGNVFAEIDLLKHFTVRTSFGGTINSFFSNSFVFTAYENAENSQNPNSYIENYGWSNSWTWTNTIKYTNTFAGQHNVTILGGIENIQNKGRAATASRGSYYVTDPTRLTVDPNLWTLNFGQAAGQTNGNILIDNNPTPYASAIYSLFGRLDYNYQDRYLLSATLRRDGSSVFDESYRYGLFPSVTAGWRISQASFMTGLTWLNDLKIRGGWGKLGSISNVVPTNAYSLFSQDPVISYYDIAGTSNAPAQGLYAAQFGNTRTSWEEDIITNIGFDATLVENKIDISAEWYKKSISGLLFQAALPATVGGANAPYINAGNIQNEGIDLSLTYHGAAVNSKLKFDITGTFTSYNNKVVNLPPGVSYYDYGNSRLEPGHPIGSFFGYKVLGLFQSADDVAKSATQEAAAPGRFKYADINGDGKITADDRTHFANPNPDFSAGLNIGASYSNFDFFLFLYASVGNEVINNIRASTDFPQQFDVAISKDAVYNSWTPDRPNAKVPILERSANFSNSTAFNSYYAENGSYLRCKTLSLGYTVPPTKLARVGIDRLRLYLQAANLFTVTKYTGLDPELPGVNTASTNFGVDGGAYPANQKTFTVGVNVSF